MSKQHGDRNGVTGVLTVGKDAASAQAAAGQETKRLGVIEGWSIRQAYQKEVEKHLMGAHCAAHDFLVGEDSDPETAPRQSVASVFVSNGTSQNAAVLEVLKWVRGRQDSFDITWGTTGSLVPTTLRQFKLENPALAASTQLFLFPGRVDPNLEAVSGPEAAEFVKSYKGRFTYAFLSAYAFDIVTGEVYFHYSHELDLQKACANLYAAHKFLFLDSRKFLEVEGRVGYTLDELLRQSRSVTIYTVSSLRDNWIHAKFSSLCESLFERCASTRSASDVEDMKCLRLRIVGQGSTAPICDERRGFLPPARD